MTDRIDLPAVVIGGGPAGLASSRELQRRGIGHVVLERGAAGESWSSRVYESLTLHTGKHMSALPGLRFDSRAPLFVSRAQFLEYLRRYEAEFRLPVHSGVTVTALQREGTSWLLETSGGSIHAASVIVASGIMSTPVQPDVNGQHEFRGALRHSSSYRRPEECRGRRVLVVGAGNSAAEIASELGRSGVETTIAIRSGANVVPLQILGVPIQYISYLIRKLPRRLQETILAGVERTNDWRRGPPPFPRATQSALDAIPVIGFRLIDAIRLGQVKLRGALDRITTDGVVFADGIEEPFDEILFATGFRPTLDFLSSRITVDRRGFASRRDRVISTDQPALYYVGHNYDSTGGLFNIRRDAPLAAEAVRAAVSR
ncbi:MAG TPA: NAD(P)/FAD-dependent oxidoreductase [Thermoanaerobaculia bacterium]|nr:NAD(P)/FAD-dependent oxidoreductase [Thermoanaerobaculia bacterium]